MFGSENKWIESAQVPSFKIHENISRPALIWRRGNCYEIVDSRKILPDFIKLDGIEAIVTRAGKTQRMTLRVYAKRQQGNPNLPHDRPESAQKLRNGPPCAIRKSSITHRGRRFRIRAPQNISDCAYTRLLDRLIEGELSIDALLGDSRPIYKITNYKAAEPKDKCDQTHEGSILFIPSAGKITSKGQDVTRDELSKEFANAPAI